MEEVALTKRAYVRMFVPLDLWEKIFIIPKGEQHFIDEGYEYVIDLELWIEPCEGLKEPIVTRIGDAYRDDSKVERIEEKTEHGIRVRWIAKGDT